MSSPFLVGALIAVVTSLLGLTGAEGLVCGALAAGGAYAIAEQTRRRALARERSLEEHLTPLCAELGVPPEATQARTVDKLSAQAQSLQRQLGTLTAVLDGMVEGVWITDAEGTVIRHNDALKALLYSGQSVLGLRPAEVVRSAELSEAVRRACASKEATRLELSIEGVRPRALAVQVSPLGREGGGSSAVFHDLTELRRLEKVRTDFVANVSHELRTPITAIRGYAETLRAGALSDATHAPKMVEIIHRQSERLSALVEDLLELSRLEGKEIELRAEPVPLREAVARAAETVRPKALGREIELDLAVPAGLCALGDERAIEQVILNLLDNAVKYTPPSGRVRVGARADGGRATLDVTDTGVGLEPKHLPRVFERFYRVDPGRTRDMGGTGLGLSIVKHLVTLMGGDVQVSSQPGEGSRFTVVFPMPEVPPR